ncbi:hypothetical protein SADUNF_Sadunf05G0060600 [Salix dunnii]|uniref:Uncharacterized protein n=1 Tax=Salix dunnii TaxID=1413687 RepID=A0A835KBQ4_9ROSI|nr:hypothetical protein SADUNF_Sadunf05G0060600 [Salix dunnii]
MEKSKSFSGYSEIRVGFEDRSKSYSFNGPAGKVDDGLESSGNPELKRRKRVAQYNMYTMEGKIKSSLRNSFSKSYREGAEDAISHGQKPVKESEVLDILGGMRMSLSA